MKSINHEQLNKLIKKGYKTKKPLYVWGTMGIGKSQVAQETAEEIAKQHQDRKFILWNKISSQEKHKVAENPENYFIFQDMRATQFDPSDLRGLPDLNSHDSVEWKPPFWLYVASQPKAKAVIFCDELNLAPPSVFKAFYQLIYDRALGEYSLSEGVYVMSAGNRAKDKANVNPLPAPLKNKFTHCQLNVPRTKDWIEWALENDIDRRIVSFLQFKKSLLYKFEPESKEKAYPTPRTWEYASNLIKGEKDLNDLELYLSISVGEGASQEMIGFLELRNEINLQEYLENPEQIENISKPDLKHSLILLTIENWVENTTRKTLEKSLKLLPYMEAEFSVLLARLLRRENESKFDKIVDPNRGTKNKIPEWETFLDEYEKYLL